MSKYKPETLTNDKAADETYISFTQADDRTPQTLNRTYKSSLFEQIFNSKSEALSLNNAINGTDYTDETKLSMTTLGGVLFMGYQNDVSFLIDSMLNLFEHQSTYNPNMPVRGLLYFSQLYRNYIDETGLDVYSSARLRLPKAQYYVFYNGTSERPDRQILKLSDSYPDDGYDIHLEVSAVMLNINYGHNRDLIDYINIGYQQAKAAEKAMNDCIRDNILKDFLIRNQTEVKTMLFDEFAWEMHKQKVLEEEKARGHAEGLAEGQAQSILDLLTDIGDLPEAIKDSILSQKDSDLLRHWLKLAARANTIEDFINRM